MINRNGTAIYMLVNEDNYNNDRYHLLKSFIMAERGIHSVRTELADSYGDVKYYRLIVKGTNRALFACQMVINISGLESDANANHDHDACIRNAQSMGVPAAWAHTPETYLSM